MLCRATQDGRVMVERSDRMWSPGKGNDKPFQYSCFENPMNSMKGQNDSMVNKTVRNAVLECNLKNDKMISVHFQGKPFNITVIHIYAPTSNAEEAEVEPFYEDLQHLLELTRPPQKRCPLTM